MVYSYVFEVHTKFLYNTEWNNSIIFFGPGVYTVTMILCLSSV